MSIFIQLNLDLTSIMIIIEHEALTSKSQLLQINENFRFGLRQYLNGL